mmetsp:Transcript_27480/g.43217  ORF Transcript_27480/g.43217 Transcript_27480/m.43217 type:complete len:333 (+) Transcript_27480:1295-2293(+)
MRIHHIPNRFGHFLPILIIHKPMCKHRLGEGQSRRHENTRPNHRVEPQYILSDNVHIGRPQFSKFFIPSPLLGIVDTQHIHTRQIIRQSIEPNIHDMIVLKPLWDRNTMRKRRSTNTQIPQPIPIQPCQNRILMLFRPNKVRICGNILHQTIVILAHLEEVTRLLNTLQRLSTRRITKVTHFRFRIRHECLLLDIVPSGISIQINVIIGSTLVPQCLSRALVTIGGGSDVIVVGDEDALIEALEAGDVLVANVDWLFVFAFGCLGDFFAVFICSRDKVGTIAIAAGAAAGVVETGETSNSIGGGSLVGMAHVCWTVGVVDGGCNVKAFFVIG